MTFSFRQSTDEDLDWIVDLRVRVLRADFERLGRFDPVRVGERLRNAFNKTNTRVILLGDQVAGCVTVRHEPEGRWLENFYLNPDLQGRGLGTQVLQRILEESGTTPIRLHMLRGSSAGSLYERHGFVAESEKDLDVIMVRQPHLKLRPSTGSDEYPRLVEIWRSAVRATHDFLDEADFARIESHLASDYFPVVTLTVAELNGQPVGFAGVYEDGLEMLFISDSVRGQGIGSALLAEVLAKQAVTKVDVNEQNPGAHGFYLSKGFVQVGRSELDGDGRPYPIIHMALQNNS